MKPTPVKGCLDYLPHEAALRDMLLTKILEVYRDNGFERIYTPVLENAENLDKSEGGENLALIFKVLKRGDKLKKAIDTGGTLSDTGLRYDLTLPLARFYANNHDKLNLPFKCIQADRVYRAEQPQKGRLREFMQCDIDIIGSDSRDCEKEIILVTSKALSAIGFSDITIRINDRALLAGALITAGIRENEIPGACIILDKLGKIGKDAVLAELSERGADIGLISEMLDADLPYFKTFNNNCSPAPADGLSDIIDSVCSLAPNGVKIEFDFSLVRGQGYYTGPIFEINSDLYRSSIAGGGRYDDMIGKFTGSRTPAVGFSIGFERIFDMLSKDKAINIRTKKSVVVFYNDGDFTAAYKTAESLTDTQTTLHVLPKKLGKALRKYEEAGFSGFMIYGKDESVRSFKGS